MLFLFEILPLFLSSIFSLVLILNKASITNLQQVVLAAVVISIIVLDRFVLRAKGSINLILRIILLFLISLSVQALVLSTGGFSSPFLILFHLFAISLSFLIDLRTATAFLLFAVLALGITTFLDERLKVLFRSDYASISLYLFSFLVIIPLSRFVAGRYHLKDALSKMLSHELKVQKSVLEGLSDIVIITDTKLKILSFNEAATRGLSKSPSELANRFLFEILILKDIKEQVINKDYLSVDQILEDKTTRIVKDLLLYIKNSTIPTRVNVQVRPTVNIDGKIDQIAFIISDAQNLNRDKGVHDNLQEALLKHQAALENLYSKLISGSTIDLARKVELFAKAENDILTALEIQDHGLKSKIELKDSSQVLSRIIVIENLFGKSLGVNLQFKIDDKYLSEAEKFVPAGSKFSAAMITSPFFTTLIDSKWFDLLIFKLLDLTILLVSGTKYPQVQVFLSYDSESVVISFIINSSLITSSNSNLFFTEYYGQLATMTGLRLGSGLEGYMAKTIAIYLGIPLNVKVEGSLINFSLKLSKKPNMLLDKNSGV